MDELEIEELLRHARVTSIPNLKRVPRPPGHASLPCQIVPGSWHGARSRIIGA
jgi:hypothetical protein